jgi:hypothetical protein
MIAGGLALASTPAAAEYPETAPVRPFNLPDLSGLTVLDLDVQMTRWRTVLPGNIEQHISSETFDLGVDVQVAPHWVIVARMPFVDADIELRPVDTSSCCAAGLGNFTLGARGLYSSRQGPDLRSVVGGELSFSLATASDRGDRAESAAIAAFARAPHDPGRYLPNTWTPRLVGHAQLYGRWFMVQGEAGLHVFLYDGDVKNDSADLGVRLALATGVRVTPELAILGEVNSMLAVDGEAGDESVSSVDLGVRYGGANLLAGLRFYLPLDDDRRDIDMWGVGGDLGVRF